MYSAYEIPSAPPVQAESLLRYYVVRLQNPRIPPSSSPEYFAKYALRIHTVKYAFTL